MRSWLPSAMSRPANSAHAELAAHARGLNLYLGRLERLTRGGTVPSADVQRAYAGAFLSFYVDLERGIEDVFMGLLMGRLTVTRPQVRSLVAIDSEVVARRVVRGDRRFVDWLPYQLTRDRAEAFFSNGEPFASISETQARPLERVRIVRNALAHGGGHAVRLFEKTFTDGVALPPEQRRPAGYLRGQHAVWQTRFEYLLADAVLVVKTLCQ